MSDKLNDGGPAFPNPAREFVDPYDVGMREKISRGVSGMSLRDYFAAKAMHAELVTNGVDNPACDAMVHRAKALGVDPIRHMANNAYEMADAMLAARSAS